MVPGKQSAWHVLSAQQWLVGSVQVRALLQGPLPGEHSGVLPHLSLPVLICAVFMEHWESSAQLHT